MFAVKNAEDLDGPYTLDTDQIARLKETLTDIADIRLEELRGHRER